MSVECRETEPITNKVYTDCNKFIKYTLEHDDTLWDVFHNHEPFTIHTLECLLEKSYLAAIHENGIYWEDFAKQKPPMIYEDQKERTYLVKRLDGTTNKVVLSLSKYNEEEWARGDIIAWANVEHLTDYDNKEKE